MLEEPFGRVQHPFANSNNNAALARHSPISAFFNDPFFSRGGFELNVPAVDLTEHGSEYVVEAELPGVRKENVEIRIGDGGQSLTIEGRSYVRSPPTTESQSAETKDAPAVTEGSAVNDTISTNDAVTQANGDQAQAGMQLSTERTFSSSSSFSRTVWLPRRVDGSKVKAKLEDGVLTVHIPKIEDPESVRVNVE